MLIEHAILGLLSVKPLTGYDIKKIMRESPFLYWSGNNNQVYRALMQLRDEGCITGEVLYADDAPTKKRYTITRSGLNELRRLSLQLPEAPDVRKGFLVQFAFCGGLSGPELEKLLDRYEEEVRGSLFIHEHGAKAGFFSDAPTPMQSEIWKLIHENVRGEYLRELDWIERVREAVPPLAEDEAKKERVELNCEAIEKNGKRYIRLTDGAIAAEADALTVVQFCAEHDTNLVLIPGECLSSEFLRLSTAVAGLVLQKLSNYRVRAAAVLDTASVRGKFREFMLETNRGSAFRIFDGEEQAAEWLTGGGEQ
ncbi:MAG: DUF4180 domain-containing protein [Clostridiales bacterium]|nr:DUF4180 domain-containing protein [Clostridiales bacterium]